LIRVEERDDQDALLSAVDQFYDSFDRSIGSQVDDDPAVRFGGERRKRKMDR